MPEQFITSSIQPLTDSLPTVRKSRAIIKVVILTIIPIALVTGSILLASKYFVGSVTSKTETKRDILVSFPMKDTDWKDLGTVFEPLIALSVKTKNGYKENKFLLDSGAVVSSLPREWAEETGQQLEFLPRSTFRGFGGTQSFAYQGQMEVLLGDEGVNLPVVFTEAVGTKSLLGRKGFFENYSIYFDHRARQIEIIK